MDPSQFGSIKNSSTTHALLKVLQPIYKALDDSQNFARLLFIDFSKAFDHIDHTILLGKLENNLAPPIVVQWYRGFLSHRQQRVKIGHTVSQWKYVKGGVPQGTLSGPELFIHMVSDLHTDVPDVKYMDDTTLVEIKKKAEGSSMDIAAAQVQDWSSGNRLGVNATKTKEMVIAFGKQPTLAPLSLDGTIIERVSQTKLLGVIISSDLKWDANTEYLHKKSTKRLYYLRCLKRAGVSDNDLLRVYLALVRSVCEYACPVWSTCLTQGQSELLESVQRRALRIIRPGLPYKDACEYFRIPTLKDRRIKLCEMFFMSLCKPEHYLHDMLPEARNVAYGLRNTNKYPVPRCKTNRYKNSFIPWCLFNCQQ